MVMVAGFTPAALAVNVMVPDCLPAFTMAVSAPLNKFISLPWKRNKQVGSPLAVARNSPAPLTSNFTNRMSVVT